MVAMKDGPPPMLSVLYLDFVPRAEVRRPLDPRALIRRALGS
jgi:hypothetical protein